ncbi:MAG: tRNA pseudouridine(13) synthase TruD [Acidobacteria bacterium]|nr:tRNA pseudouridine(13) synthase TruD [Acidobacteriota bacterium]MBI3655005.1 tRNA pseudouridine(13) synthase TruD [Acidobacteriota bacterium]
MDIGPYVTPDLGGIGGIIKQQPADFEVEEIPLYQPCGEGEHLYLLVEKEGISTHELVAHAAQIFSISPRRIGFAGLKDKWARARQTISIPGISDVDALRLNGARARVLSVARHHNKLRIGHLAGNLFRLLIRNVQPDAADRAQAVLDALAQCGLPNYFGEQRFGHGGDFGRARQWVTHPPRRPLRRELRLEREAYQSYLFNRYLARRIDEGWFPTLLEGDIAMKHSTGGLFVIENVENERPRAAAFEISATGPLFGYRMMMPLGQAGALEAAVLQQEGISMDMTQSLPLKRACWYGSRRFLRARVSHTGVEMTTHGLTISFELPKGAYATVLLREIMKTGVSSSH